MTDATEHRAAGDGHATPDRAATYFSGTVSTGLRRGTYTVIPAGWYTAIKKVDSAYGIVQVYRWTRS